MNDNPFEELIATIVSTSSKEEMKSFFLKFHEECFKHQVFNGSQDEIFNSLYDVIKKNHPEHLHTLDKIFLLK